jgi:hypothetical protein
MDPEVIARRIINECDLLEISQAGAPCMNGDECIHTLAAEYVDGDIRVQLFGG